MCLFWMKMLRNELLNILLLKTTRYSALTRSEGQVSFCSFYHYIFVIFQVLLSEIVVDILFWAHWKSIMKLLTCVPLQCWIYTWFHKITVSYCPSMDKLFSQLLLDRECQKWGMCQIFSLNNHLYVWLTINFVDLRKTYSESGLFCLYLFRDVGENKQSFSSCIYYLHCNEWRVKVAFAVFLVIEILEIHLSNNCKIE